MPYVGRFAPSPSGQLHFGSLIAALGSYFQAKSQCGRWLVRIEDLDPPREMPGAATQILNTLESFHLFWDGDVLYQSSRHERYQAQIDQWIKNDIAYYCQCTRKQIQQAGGYYQGTCLGKQLNLNQPHSVRLRVDDPITRFNDIRHGEIIIPTPIANEDFIIKRRDGLFAYNLAVVIDDIDQGVTEVVRGADLIEPTGRQINLYRYLNQPEVSYLHLPLALDEYGQKRSKQNHAPAIDEIPTKKALINAMTFLGFHLPTDFESASIEQMILWGIEHWRIEQLPNELSRRDPF